MTFAEESENKLPKNLTIQPVAIEIAVPQYAIFSDTPTLEKYGKVSHMRFKPPTVAGP
jgi:hypothetical protein